MTSSTPGHQLRTSASRWFRWRRPAWPALRGRQRGLVRRLRGRSRRRPLVLLPGALRDTGQQCVMFAAVDTSGQHGAGGEEDRGGRWALPVDVTSARWTSSGTPSARPLCSTRRSPTSRPCRQHLDDRDWLVEQSTDRDCMLLRKFQRELRPVFEASARERRPRRRRPDQRPDGPLPDHPAHLRPRGRPAHPRRVEDAVGRRAAGRRGTDRPGVPDLRPRPHPARDLRRRQVRQRLRRHVPQRLAPLLLRPVLLARQRGGVPRSAEEKRGPRPVHDGPLIVQSDKTLLARGRPRARPGVSPRDRAVRRAGAVARSTSTPTG